ncbi:hypothetical protein BMS3Bbin14_01073 [bacterium BMS3Bbin14]|nr:hypothetical protein BMS3Bbin14_01073 [bacterium BMS3Bbin14]HDK44464.1 hypothetical protein [Desulfobacteraceae bacterium]HDL98815.1 hypothetical protein [Desulfobacteraceae bacterium]HDO30850.1 hypothetical protein [Desulfobacteraceae bacterium]
MKSNNKLATVRQLMLEFAEITGLFPATSSPKRYLWTDAFGVCNFLELYRQTGEDRYLDLAVALVEQVHAILGRHRDDDERTGWISGLDEEAGKRHPTRGGLRIGKKMAERDPSEPYDEQQEWDRDGQYYHYLTKWMHALSRLGRVTGEQVYNQWAVELAQTAHARFTYISPLDGRKRMYWKMSIDLSRPLVTAMGQHDPLDGLITCHELQVTAGDEEKSASPDLQDEIRDLAAICRGLAWETDDPLGIGGLLFDACRTVQMIDHGFSQQASLPEELLQAALAGLQTFVRTNTLKLPAAYRLAFRELGLTIGMHGVGMIHALLEEKTGLGRKHPLLVEYIEILLKYSPIIDLIENFWLDPEQRSAASWRDHREINMVMLATSLLPDGFLRL